MYRLNGTLLARRPTPWHGKLSNSAGMLWGWLAMQLPSLRPVIALVLLVSLPLLTACAHQSASPSELPRNPPMPQPSQPQPLEDYLTRVERNIRLWDQKLRDTLGTP